MGPPPLRQCLSTPCIWNEPCRTAAASTGLGGEGETGSLTEPNSHLHFQLLRITAQHLALPCTHRGVATALSKRACLVCFLLASRTRPVPGQRLSGRDLEESCSPSGLLPREAGIRWHSAAASLCWMCACVSTHTAAAFGYAFSATEQMGI